jgi:hypothetical protein
VSFGDLAAVYSSACSRPAEGRAHPAVLFILNELDGATRVRNGAALESDVVEGSRENHRSRSRIHGKRDGGRGRGARA